MVNNYHEELNMKLGYSLSIGTITGTISFICAYFMNLTMNNSEQYLATISVILLDGFFGIIAGIKREGFQTRKAVKVLQNLVVWILILTVLLSVELGFVGTSWLSETVLIPFIILQLISALKNASMAGLIDNKIVNTLMDKIDNHKGKRKK